jgi:hypothetical protein
MPEALTGGDPDGFAGMRLEGKKASEKRLCESRAIERRDFA